MNTFVEMIRAIFKYNMQDHATILDFSDGSG